MLDEYRSFSAAAETFFKTIKAEILWQQSWRTRRDAKIAISNTSMMGWMPHPAASQCARMIAA
ncbi:hypothetical protein [Pseudorhodobacter turbinis]|uniref:hypothetical protein n=1 Tax=Pseudorhodobacter turbinis TaxID=2500533 RepID=UPI00143E00D1|nr:hypothetical protein [Pseudorhodobacter turbinis]